ncbi:protein phosphatase 2C domain-containing protein [Sphingomonas sp. MMSM20]|uniref:protein phosphatase 2C domain-containing protein n=1 Tax=Sphingomonas lycopersici TaxID=2951807 RepID=UPI002237E63D|nr:protein phosphatase 2C domain-containing protein [Sphingomonas lycopersici]MCW6528865.1 protein phosphatase 2C domain-containing protein [Sphingomonas lycopersici]
MLKINLAATDSQAFVNEDVVGHHGNAAWVIDGATGIGAALLDAPSDASWLAHRVDAAFRALLAEQPMIATTVLVRRAIEICRDALAAAATRAPEGPHEHPSAAFAMLRDFGDHVELTSLADCAVAYVDEAGQAQLFSDGSHETIERRTLDLAAQIFAADPDPAPAALTERLLPQLQANRRLMNRADGYWVLGIEPDAADHLSQRRLPARKGQRFALVSDGFLRLVDLFGVATPHDLLAIDDAAQWDAWLARLRAIEREPESRRHYVRVKIHDDATLLTLHI